MMTMAQAYKAFVDFEIGETIWNDDDVFAAQITAIGNNPDSMELAISDLFTLPLARIDDFCGADWTVLEEAGQDSEGHRLIKVKSIQKGCREGPKYVRMAANNICRSVQNSLAHLEEEFTESDKSAMRAGFNIVVTREGGGGKSADERLADYCKEREQLRKRYFARIGERETNAEKEKKEKKREKRQEQKANKKKASASDIGISTAKET